MAKAKKTKKVAVKKKKAAPKKEEKKTKAAKPSPLRSLTRDAGIPCICIQKRGRWFCMKREPDGSLVRCDGPFATQAECEEHLCVD